MYVPRQIIEELDLDDDGLIRWYLTDDGDVCIEFDHQRYGVFDDDDSIAPMGGDALETHDLAGAERSTGDGESDFSDGFGRWEDADDLYRECPLCGTEVYEGKVGGHPDRHWDEIVALVENQ